jgi:peroxiredoxin
LSKITKKKVIYIIGLLLSFFLGCIFTISMTQLKFYLYNYSQSQKNKSSSLNNPAPEIIAKLISNNKNWVLSDQKGKIIILYFWSPNCNACNLLSEEVNKLYNDFNNDDFSIIGITTFFDSDIISCFIKKKGSKWTQIYQEKYDPKKNILSNYDIHRACPKFMNFACFFDS